VKRQTAARSPVSARIKAVLAGALVLGVGGSMTVAAWTDDTYAQGSFGTSVFDVESNVSKPYVAAGTWSDAATGPGSTLVFNAAAMSPTVSFYAPIAIRTKTNSTSGSVALLAPTLTGSSALNAAMQYRAVRLAGSETCSVAAFTAGAVYMVGNATTYSPLATGQNTGVTNTLTAATSTAAGVPTQFCLEVRLPSGAANTLQGQTAVATWQFASVSNE
jgi:predicted ribosomally synthesized peptide with SipW-like signal peptide